MAQHLLKQAAALMQAGNFSEASALCRRVLETAPRNVDALHLLAVAAWKSGDAAGAEARFRQCLAVAPGHPAVLVGFGDFLRAARRLPEAEGALREATRRAPTFVPAWRRLGLLLHAERKLDDAYACARRVTELAPRDPAAWELLAAVEQRRNRLPEAMAACREGLRHAPSAARLHYSLAQLLREDCEFAGAVEAYDAALRHGFAAPELYQNLAEARLEAGDADGALACFSAGIARFPDNALLQRLHARFHWEHGASGDPLAKLREAARKQPTSGALWEALVGLLNRLERWPESLDAVAEARAGGCSETPDLLRLEAVAQGALGRAAEATARFERLLRAHPQNRTAKLAFAAHLLATHDPIRAEQVCAEVLTEDPHAQLAWAYRGTAWRLLGDARESWLLDYQRMVIPVRVQPPSAYEDATTFYRDVRRVLEGLHRTHAHPIDQTLRGGTQTNGFLFRYKEPVLRQLEAQIRAGVQEVLASFPTNPRHPFWGRSPADGRFLFAGAWSVRLRSQGFHTNHIHPQGWISSALYVSLPQGMSDNDGTEGHIQFGVPPVELGLDLPARRMVKPEVGALLLFPSYMWHGTVPFTSEEPRITVAFDLVPAG